MRKIALIVALVLLLTGCGQTEVRITTPPEPTAATQPATVPTTIAETSIPETTAGEPVESAAEAGEAYVLNVNSMKFHLPSCGSAKRIKETNRKDVVATREQLIAQGYDPCGNCDP